MNAIEYKEYGSPQVFEFNQVLKPKPKSNEVLVKVHSSTVTAADIMMREGKPLIGRLYLGIKRPKRTILGFEFAGEVVEVGNNVVRFKVGDKVFGGTTTLGCYSEYVCISEKDVITTMPEGIDYEEAAPVSGSAITVFNFLVGLAKIKKGQKILIIGASGGLGTYAIQIAKHFGAVVTGVCSTENVNLVYTLGADDVIDYNKTDFTGNGEQYDIIFDTVNKSSFSKCKKSVAENGIYLPTVFGFNLLVQIFYTSLFGSKKIKTSSTGLLPVKVRLNYFEEIKELLKTGKIKTVIDKKYSLSQMAEAHSYVEKGHKKGNVVIEINSNYQSY
jgi:NADPH:quinone reductase-like Zn-dependent oxidoreductase